MRNRHDRCAGRVFYFGGAAEIKTKKDQQLFDQSADPFASDEEKLRVVALVHVPGLF